MPSTQLTVSMAIVTSKNNSSINRYLNFIGGITNGKKNFERAEYSGNGITYKDEITEDIFNLDLIKSLMELN